MASSEDGALPLGWVSRYRELTPESRILLIQLLGKFQADKELWTEYNFPGESADKAFFGMVEELGELAHARLKADQGIREFAEALDKEETDTILRTMEMDAIGDYLMYLMHYCSARNLGFADCLYAAWDEIKKRDWQKFPTNGRTE